MLTPYMPQLKLVAQHHPSRTREFAFDAATAVATAHCEHAVHPLPLQAGLSLAQRKVAAKAHAGLCGVSLAAVIVGLQFSDISETATRRSVPVSYAVFRNQVRDVDGVLFVIVRYCLQPLLCLCLLLCRLTGVLQGYVCG